MPQSDNYYSTKAVTNLLPHISKNGWFKIPAFGINVVGEDVDIIKSFINSSNPFKIIRNRLGKMDHSSYGDDGKIQSSCISKDMAQMHLYTQ